MRFHGISKSILCYNWLAFLLKAQGEIAIMQNQQIRFEMNVTICFKIPGTPIAYWASDAIINTFVNPLLSSLAFSDGQILTGNNDKYIRFIWEVSKPLISSDGHWMFHAKGGEFRKWYGNLDSVVAWDKESISHFKKDRIARFPKDEILFRSGITWNLISSYPILGVRFLPSTQTFNKAAASLLFYSDKNIFYVLGFVNTIVATKLMRILNPTLNTNIKDVLSLPIILNGVGMGERVIEIVKGNICQSKLDWDAFETSWDFKKHPLI